MQFNFFTYHDYEAFWQLLNGCATRPSDVYDKCGRGDVTNIATVLYDHRFSETAGPIRKCQRCFEAWLVQTLVCQKEDTPTVRCRGMGGWESGASEVERAVPRKLCHVLLRSSIPIGQWGTVDAHFRKIPAVIGQISHPRFVVCAVHSSPILFLGLRRQREPPSNDARAIPVSPYGNDAENVRSDKDSEPETYGEGIKKKKKKKRNPVSSHSLRTDPTV